MGALGYHKTQSDMTYSGLRLHASEGGTACGSGRVSSAPQYPPATAGGTDLTPGLSGRTQPQTAVGTVDLFCRGVEFNRPYGTGNMVACVPALKRWAKFACPYGTS